MKKPEGKVILSNVEALRVESVDSRVVTIEPDRCGLVVKVVKVDTVSNIQVWLIWYMWQNWYCFCFQCENLLSRVDVFIVYLQMYVEDMSR